MKVLLVGMALWMLVLPMIGLDIALDTQRIGAECNPGGPDPEFSADGKVVTDVQGASDLGRGVAIQPDGKIVVAGSAFNGTNYDFAVVRYNTDGSLDPTFDGDGKATTPVLSGDDFANGVVLQPDGKIILAGYTLNAGNNDFAVVRFNVTGTLDTSFDGDGKAIFAILAASDKANAVALQPDGKILVVGSSDNGSDEDFTAIRLNSDGSLDPTFNLVGVTTFAIRDADDVANSVVLQTDGKIVVAGTANAGNDQDFAVARLTPDGQLDPAFDADGRASTGIRVGDDLAYSAAIQADGRIVVAGTSRGSGPDTDFAAVRYDTDGSLDNSFDTDGRVTTFVRGPNDEARAVAVQPDGRIVLAGFSNDGSNSDFAAVRLLTDGSLDTTFDLDGKVTTAVQTGDDQAFGVVIQPDGKIVAAGDSVSGVTTDIALVRYGSECFPEIEVTGNGVPIANGAGTPTLADHTDFGLASTIGGSVVRTFTINNLGTANLVLSNPTISGTNAGDFTVTQSPVSPVTTPAGSTTFMVTFIPSAVGVRTATVNIVNDDSDEDPYTFAIQGTGLPPFAGEISVGTGQTYTSLTNAGGLFEALNAAGLSGNVTINLTSDLTAETGDVALRNQMESGAGAGTYQILIKPSAAPRIVSGSKNGSLIRLDGADRVSIDGWAAAVIGGAPGGSATRDLTITNTSVIGSPSVVSIINANGSPAKNNTIQNATVTGTLGTHSGILIGGITPDPAPGPDNDNNHILSCLIMNADYGVYTLGESPGNPNIGTRLERNVINATGSDRIRLVGIAVRNENGIQILSNDIGNIDRGTDPGTVAGIAVGLTDLHTTLTGRGGVIDAFVSGNKIDGAVSSAGYTAAGIAVAGGSGTSNVIVNNMITGVRSTATAPDIVAGILVSATRGSSTKIYHNSVAMTGDRGNANIPTSPSFALAIAGIAPVEVKNNVFYTTQTAIFGSSNAKSFAVGLSASTFINLDSNFNDFLSTGLADGGFRTGGFFTEFTDHTDLAAWQAETARDANSQEVDPIFVDPTSDLHLRLISPVVNDGTPIPTVLIDFDGDARSATAPDIGADEFTGTPEISVEDFNSTVLVDGTSTVDFGSEALLQPGTPKTFTVRNVGTDPLIVDTTISVTGANASEFVVNNAGMSPTVAPGGNTSFTVTFTPTATGTRTAALSIANNDSDENPFNFAIQGTGIIPAPQTRHVATTGSDTGPNNCLTVGSPCATIAHAISVANAGDTVSIAAGTYTEFGLVVSKNLIFTGAGAATTFVQASGSVLTSTDRVFTVNGSVVASMTGFTIQNGKAPNGAAGADCTASPCTAVNDGREGGSGGGILNNGTLTLTSVTLSNNRSGKGGTAGNVTCVTGPCNNLGGKGGLGGAVGTTGQLAVISSTFTNNTTGDAGDAGTSSGCVTCSSNPGEQGNGGAIGGTIASVTGSTFTGNTGYDGGAIQQGLSAITITDSTLSSNTAANSGGAINCNGTAVPHTCSISGSTINNNHVSGSYGGAVAFFSSSVKDISNSTVSNNTSNGDAGGILAYAGTVNITFVTIAGNTADDNDSGTGDGGGLRNEVAICNLKNTIIADNVDKRGEADQISGVITSRGYNHIESTIGGTFIPITGDVINSGPALAPLANNGGPTQTQGLYADSPAIDQIPNGTNGCGIAPFNADQRGGPRPVGAACDKGAFEGNLGVAPQEIDVTGLGISILDGDVTPSTADETDFGSVPPSDGLVEHTFTIHNSGTDNLIISNPVFTGPNASDFTVTVPPVSPVAPSGTTTFTVRFDPSVAGLRSATLSIVNNDNNENPYNFAIQGTGVETFTGTIDVGTGQSYTSLTNVDGLFSAFDTGIVSGDVTINLTSDLTAETGEFGLRTLTESGVGNYRVLIKPSAPGRIVSGSFNGTLIRIDGADRVTIDGWSGATIGSPAGSPATRDLTITNTATSGTPAVLSIINTHTNPSLDNTFQNLNVQGTAATQAGIIIGGATGPDVNNSHILSCSIKSTDFGIFTFGESQANPNTGTRIEHNVINATGADRVRFIGITVQNESAIQIIGNNIGNIDAASVSGVVMGIGVGVLQESQFNVNSTISGGVVGALVSGNTIAGAKTNTNFSAGGIVVAGGAGTNTIVNNMISGVRSAATSPDVVAGIFVAGTAGSTTRVYNNSISMTGDRGNLSLSPSFGLAITGSDPTVELKNNIFYTTQTAIGGGAGALSFAIGTNSSTFLNLDSNYNAFFSSGPQDAGFRTGGLIVGFTNHPDLAAWRTAVSDDANSLEVDPTFVDPELNPHLQLGSFVSNAATTLASVTSDIDGQPRSLTAPDIGADEIVGTPDIAVLDHDLTILINGASTVDLGSEIVAVPGAAKTFTVRNVGTDPLSLSTTITVTGTNASEFVVNSAGMSPTVAIGDNTMFTVTFTPTGPGVRTAAISITSNDPDENPFTFALRGTGIATYTVTYDGNGNTGGTPPVDAGNPYVAGSLVGVLGPGTLVKTGSQFTGWNTVANGSGTQYSPAQAFVINANTTLFAQWTVLQCAPGGLDPAFGTGGKVATDVLGNSDNGRGAAVQADGKIVVAGSANTGSNYDFAVARYNADGTLDTSFDTDGKATTDIVNSDDFGNAVAIQPDGKIVVAGSAHNGANYDFAVARFNTDGSLDTSFDTDGKKSFAVVPGDDFANAIVIQPDGKIVMVGYGNNGSNDDFTVVRLSSDGSFDATFSADGIVTAGILTNNDFGYGVALQADGKVVVSGYTNAGANNDFALMRFNPNGSLDTSFGTGGSVSTAFLSGDDESYSVAIQVDGKIALAGHSVTVSGIDFAVARYNTDGSLDTSFDTDGKLTTDILGADDFAESVAIQPDGRVVVGGHTNSGSNTDFAVIRLNTNGTFDTSFDADGKAVIAVSGLDDKAYEVAIQRDGKILVVGDTVTSSDRDLAIVRLGGPCTPEANVKGNAISIVDGDVTPDVADGTAFGVADITTGSVTHTFTIENLGTADLNLGAVTSTFVNRPELGKLASPEGVDNFTVTQPLLNVVIPGGSTTFTVTFDPVDVGSHVSTISIANNDPDENPFNFTVQGTGDTTTLQFSAATYSGPESRNATVTVTRIGITSGTSTVQYATSNATAVGGASCGVAGVDYISTSGTLTFNPSDTSMTFPVTLCSDTLAESPAETLSVTLSNVTGGTLGSQSTSTAMISDAATQFTNNTQINMTDGSPGAPYPSTIHVTGLSGAVMGVRFTLFNVTVPRPQELSVLLVDPSGTRSFVVMQGVGGLTPMSGTTITLEDSATSFMPMSTPIAPGQNYKPTNCLSGPGSFPPPAPAPPYGNPSCTGTPPGDTFVSKFSGIGANGDWSLYTFDALDPAGALEPLGSGSFIGGWGIQFLIPTAADVSISGRVTRPDGSGIGNATLTLIGGHLPQPLRARTNPFGYYRIEGVEAGETYILLINSKRYSFTPPSRVINLLDEAAEIDFVAGSP